MCLGPISNGSRDEGGGLISSRFGCCGATDLICSRSEVCALSTSVANMAFEFPSMSARSESGVDARLGCGRGELFLRCVSSGMNIGLEKS